MEVLISEKLATRKENHRGDFVRFTQDGAVYLEVDGNPEDEWVLVWPLKPTDIAPPYTYDEPREPPRVQQVDWVRLDAKFAELEITKRTGSEIIRPALKPVQSPQPASEKSVGKTDPSDEEERSLIEQTRAEPAPVQVKAEKMKAKHKKANKSAPGNEMDPVAAHLHQAWLAKASSSEEMRRLSYSPLPPNLPPLPPDVILSLDPTFEEKLMASVLSDARAAYSR